MSTATPVREPNAEDKRRKRLLSYSAKNMFYSMAAVLVLVFAVWAITPNPPESQRRPAEIESSASYAASEVDWPVWTPTDLAPEWSGSFVRFGVNNQVPTWRIGMVSPQEEFVQIRQAVDPGKEWLAISLDGLEDQGSTVSFDGPTGAQEWELWTGIDDNDIPQVGLVLPPGPEQPATTVVNGTADTPEIAEFIQGLGLATS
ncbi:MAG: DUF4245 domain-containing protein [Ornithinimicrobium sp.]